MNFVITQRKCIMIVNKNKNDNHFSLAICFEKTYASFLAKRNTITKFKDN